MRLQMPALNRWEQSSANSAQPSARLREPISTCLRLLEVVHEHRERNEAFDLWFGDIRIALAHVCNQPGNIEVFHLRVTPMRFAEVRRLREQSDLSLQVIFERTQSRDALGMESAE